LNPSGSASDNEGTRPGRPADYPQQVDVRCWYRPPKVHNNDSAYSVLKSFNDRTGVPVAVSAKSHADNLHTILL
jgi:hypothetical protein